MARPLRIEYKGACYHVMNRGNQRARVFHSKKHYRLFLEKLAHFCEQFDVGVHSYCCMPNHFHLLLTTREANLSRFMQSFLTSFTLSLNRMRSTSGHVFQGRFKAELVEAQRYLSEASRYIHLNPVRTKRADSLDLVQRKRELDSFPWSSYPVLVGLANRPKWIDTEPVLRTWGEDGEEAMRNYRRYVDQGLTANLPNPFLSVKEQSILGSDSFVDTIRRRHLLKREITDEREEPALKHLVRSLQVADVLTAVAAVYEVPVLELVKRRSRNAEARQMAMYLATRFSRHAQPLSRVAKQFGITAAGLSIAAKRMTAALSIPSGKTLRARCSHAEDLLNRSLVVDS